MQLNSRASPLIIKLCKSLATLIFFLFVYFLIYYIHARYFQVDVVFFSAIEDCLYASLIMGITIFSFHFFSIFNSFEKILLVFCLLLLGYCAAISIPTVLDRSLSFYILEKLQQRGGGISKGSFEYVFTKEYVNEHHLVDVRLTEQLESGTIIIKNNCVLLTKKGTKIASISRFFRKNLLPTNRLLMGTYSADLTDPFKDSENLQSYTCTGE
jgi:hypothetical protein